MYFSGRSKVGGLLSLLTILTIFSTFVISGVFVRGTIVHAAGEQTYSVTKGTITPSATVTLKKLPTLISPHAIGTPLPRGVDHIHRNIHRTAIASSGSNGQIS